LAALVRIGWPFFRRNRWPLCLGFRNLSAGFDLRSHAGSDMSQTPERASECFDPRSPAGSDGSIDNLMLAHPKGPLGREFQQVAHASHPGRITTPPAAGLPPRPPLCALRRRQSLREHRGGPRTFSVSPRQSPTRNSSRMLQRMRRVFCPAHVRDVASSFEAFARQATPITAGMSDILCKGPL
jgi:hypothetical protein